MLSNKIIADRPLAGNENRAHIHKASRYNQMTPMPASGGAAGSVRGAGPNDLPPPIRGDLPILTDPHQNQRGHQQNLKNMPREISPARHQAETRARLYDRGRTNSKSRT
jgi:hypothetical protein